MFSDEETPPDQVRIPAMQLTRVQPDSPHVMGMIICALGLPYKYNTCMGHGTRYITTATDIQAHSQPLSSTQGLLGFALACNHCNRCVRYGHIEKYFKILKSKTCLMEYKNITMILYIRMMVRWLRVY